MFTATRTGACRRSADVRKPAFSLSAFWHLEDSRRRRRLCEVLSRDRTPQIGALVGLATSPGRSAWMPSCSPQKPDAADAACKA